jgi:3-oxoacyl-[acyl-carrier-protein] synthase II
VGLVIPTGIGVETSWKNICEGRSGIGPLTRFDGSGFETKIAAEVKDFHPELYIEKKEIKKMDLFIQYRALRKSPDDAQLQITPENCERIGVIVGMGLGGLPTLEKYHQILSGRPDGSLRFHSHAHCQHGFRADCHAFWS